ncbi:LysR substrate-binding domain-containing protein [Arenibaculum pallidiluteum]|uniref:LysR substrate-binding domain-containing protein n=1 Tax=Arenibaculum pallidiluteum TaxID=2812559 RepID=UPI001A95CA48|nr:LysR substrate-binding domain-containing protein [Arenibaculum pallidiluteum]
MNLRDLRYVLAVAEHRHFGRAAEACHVSQPTLSAQIRKLEDSLGAPLFERTNRWVVPTDFGARVLVHAARAVEEADAIAALGRSAGDPLAGPLRLGVIPTLGPYLMPLVFGPARHRFPRLALEPWEDLTGALLDRLRGRRLDAALVATPVPPGEFAERPLFTEPFLAALPPEHPLAGRERLDEPELAPDLLVLSDGHCLRDQALAACNAPDPSGGSLRAASLETLVNMVAAGFGTTLVPGLAAGALRGRNVVLRPLAAPRGRTVRLVWRPSFPRAAALDALAQLVREVLSAYGGGDGAGSAPADLVPADLVPAALGPMGLTPA